MLATERVLGPRWSLKELRTFYILLKAYGKQWERLEERLPSRSNAMIRALFDMHRGYLSLPEASAEGFCTIMTDHYKSLDELQREPKMEKEVATATVASCTDIEMEEAPSTPQQPPRQPPLQPPTPVSVWSILPVETTPVGNVLATPTTTRVREETPSSDTRTKKKRKLEKFLMRDEYGSPANEIDSKVDAMKIEPSTNTNPHPSEDAIRIASRRRIGFRKALRTSDQHAATAELPQSDRLGARKFKLPWFYWFYSFVDTDFFAHNEFVDCLHRMQLGNLVKVARPIWSSVRASMGNPRRLSQSFLGEEKKKLDHYREVKRRGETTPVPVPPIPQHSSQWPYRTPVALASGLRVLAHLSHPRRFVFGTIENFSVRDGMCKVRLDNNGSRVCSLDSVMIFADESQIAAIPDTTTPSPPSLVVDPAVNVASLALSEHAYQDKLAAIALVRDLLKRKELLVNAMTKMNAQARILRHNFATVDCVASSTLSDEILFQRQYAWLVVNLDVTNRYLRAALLRLQDVSRVTRPTISGSSMLAARSNSFNTASGFAAAAQPMAPSNDAPPATLTLEHMRWAVNFLTLSRKKTAELVADRERMDNAAAAQGQVEESEQPTETQPPVAGLAPDTHDLVANCLALASVIRRGSSTTIPPLITQKLMERMFELLEPRFDSNMDLYAELRSAAAGFTELQRQIQSQATATRDTHV